MDPITHATAAALMTHVGFRGRVGPAATVLAAIASVAPDGDFLFRPARRLLGEAGVRFSPALEALLSHRGITHSFLGAAAVGAIVGLAGGLVLYVRARRKARRESESASAGASVPDPAAHPEILRMRARAASGLSPRVGLGWIVLCCAIAGAMHVPVDLLTISGLPPWAPFSDENLSLGVMGVMDPLLLLLLPASVIGAEWLRRRHRGRAAAILAVLVLCGLVGYVAAARVMQARVGEIARQAFAEAAPEGLVSGRLEIVAVPTASTPLLWHVVGRDEARWYAARVRPWYSPDRVAETCEQSPRMPDAAMLLDRLGTRYPELDEDHKRFAPWIRVQRAPDAAGQYLLNNLLHYGEPGRLSSARPLRVRLDGPQEDPSRESSAESLLSRALRAFREAVQP